MARIEPGAATAPDLDTQKDFAVNNRSAHYAGLLVGGAR